MVTGGLEAATDVVSLDGGSAWDLLWAKDRGASLPHLRARSIGPIQLARLSELLGLGNLEAALRGFSLLAGESQESPWVVSFPEPLARALVGLAPEGLEDVASRWARAEDMSIGRSSAVLRAYLEELRRLLDSTAGPFVLLVRVE